MVTVVATRTIEGARERETKLTMELLESAISIFSESNPLRGWTYSSGPFGLVPPFGPFPPGAYDAYRRDFGPYPPHYDWYDEGRTYPIGDEVRQWTLAQHPTPTVVPTTIFDSRVLLFSNPNLFTVPPLTPQFFAGAGTSHRIDQTLGRHHNGGSDGQPGEYGDPDALNPRRRDIENSESLYYWLTTLAPETNSIMDKLPRGARTNTDWYARVDGAPKVRPLPDSIDPLGDSSPTTPGPDDKELFEIRDAWGNVINYWVYYMQETTFDGMYHAAPLDQYITPVPVLESAGPDGKFGHRPGIGLGANDPLDIEADLGDNLFSRPPPWYSR